MPTKLTAATAPRARYTRPYVTIKSAAVVMPGALPSRSFELIEQIEEAVADLTAAPNEVRGRKLADRIYKATADLRATMFNERFGRRQVKEEGEE